MAGLDSPLRKLTPWVLLALAGIVWFEDVLPLGGLRRLLGDTGLMRFVLGVVCLYTMFSVIERQRMEVRFREVLGEFKRFYDARASARESEADKNREAIRILAAAVSSTDAEVRSSAVANLKRLTGKDFGEDSQAWAAWLDSTGGGGAPEAGDAPR